MLILEAPAKLEELLASLGGASKSGTAAGRRLAFAFGLGAPAKEVEVWVMAGTLQGKVTQDQVARLRASCRVWGLGIFRVDCDADMSTNP